MPWKRLSYSHRIEAGETQTQALIVRLADLQSKVKGQPSREVSADKVRALIGKHWDPVSWDGDVWEDVASDGTPVLASPPLSEEQPHKAEVPQNQSSPPSVISGPVARPKS